MIKNLLFDLGGVILDIKRDNCVDAFRRLGMANPGELLDPYTQRGPFLRLESGQISPGEFRAELRTLMAESDRYTDAEIDAAFCEFLVGIPRQRLVWLRHLRQRYKIYMLSNTNPIMWDSRIASEFRQEGHDVNYYFDGIVTSFEARCVKPDARIFAYTTRRLGIDPAETLFLDDGAANVEAATALGFGAALVAEGTEFIDYIPQ